MLGNRASILFRYAVRVALLVLAATVTCAGVVRDIVVKVPFDFQAGETLFAPGEYVLSMDRISTGSVMIRSADRARSAILLAHKSIAAGSPGTTTVSFRAYGDSRFLSAIEDGGNAHERWEVIPSVREVFLARTTGQATVASLRAEPSGKKPN